MMLGMHPWAGSSDDVRLGVLTEWVTADLVDEVLAECGTRDQRPGALPARFMVYYVLALALLSGVILDGHDGDALAGHVR